MKKPKLTAGRSKTPGQATESESNGPLNYERAKKMALETIQGSGPNLAARDQRLRAVTPKPTKVLSVDYGHYRWLGTTHTLQDINLGVRCGTMFSYFSGQLFDVYQKDGNKFVLQSRDCGFCINPVLSMETLRELVRSKKLTVPSEISSNVIRLTLNQCRGPALVVP